MWIANMTSLSMCEGDFGMALPIKISGVTLGDNDSVKVTFKDRPNGEIVLEKTYDGISGNTVSLEFTEEESNLFPVGSYAYSLDWYQNGDFLCNIIPLASFKVVDKA